MPLSDLLNWCHEKVGDRTTMVLLPACIRREDVLTPGENKFNSSAMKIVAPVWRNRGTDPYEGAARTFQADHFKNVVLFKVDCSDFIGGHVKCAIHLPTIMIGSKRSGKYHDFKPFGSTCLILN